MFKRRWYQFSLRTLFLATAVLALLLGAAVHFRLHLAVRFMEVRGVLDEVCAIPAGPMPDAPDPTGWVPCHFGPLHFDLPPEMAANVVIPENGAPVRVFHDDCRSVIVGLPESTGEMHEFLETDLMLPPEGRGMSLPRLRLACCQASSADFRWTMSRDELGWHAWRIAMSPLLRPRSDGRAETMFRADLDGIVQFSETGRLAAFHWEAADKQVGAFMHFKDSSGELDPTWVRCVCKSVRLCEEPHPAEPERPAQRADSSQGLGATHSGRGG